MGRSQVLIALVALPMAAVGVFATGAAAAGDIPVKLSPAAGPRGTVVTVSATLPANCQEPLSLYVDAGNEPNNRIFSDEHLSATNGVFSHAVTIPASLAPPAGYPYAYDTLNFDLSCTGGVYGSATFDVTDMPPAPPSQLQIGFPLPCRISVVPASGHTEHLRITIENGAGDRGGPLAVLFDGDVTKPLDIDFSQMISRIYGSSRPVPYIHTVFVDRRYGTDLSHPVPPDSCGGSSDAAALPRTGGPTAALTILGLALIALGAPLRAQSKRAR